MFENYLVLLAITESSPKNSLASSLIISLVITVLSPAGPPVGSFQPTTSTQLLLVPVLTCMGCCGVCRSDTSRCCGDAEAHRENRQERHNPRLPQTGRSEHGVAEIRRPTRKARPPRPRDSVYVLRAERNPRGPVMSPQEPRQQATYFSRRLPRPISRGPYPSLLRSPCLRPEPSKSGSREQVEEEVQLHRGAAQDSQSCKQCSALARCKDQVCRSTH